MIALRELLEGVDVLELDGDPETGVSCVAYDSRRTGTGCVFIAVRGEKVDGTAFIKDAVDKGASSVVFEEYSGERAAGAAYVKVAHARDAMARIAAAFHGHPSSRLALVGITGTNGKTTTSYLVRSVLESGGHATGLLGTISYQVGGQTLPAPNTTPESVDLQAHLASMAQSGARYAVVEVSSHAVALGRVTACDFAVRVFTNFTQDHLDFHGSMDDYFATKKKFFSSGGGVCVVNMDDPRGPEIAAGSGGAVITYGVEGPADVTAGDIVLSRDGIGFTLVTPRGEAVIGSRLTGRHNIYNILAAAGACLGLGLEPGAIARGINAMTSVPGRLERVEAGQDFTVLVDYAHTEDALARAASAAREFTEGRLITLFGCGGDRDRTKRPGMGRVAARLSDLVVLTSDNPRTEEPARILADAEAGIAAEGSKKKGAGYFVLPDRAAAIEFAVGLAKKGDTILLAGKGHEDYQIVGAKKLHFDDRETAAAAIKRRHGA